MRRVSPRAVAAWAAVLFLACGLTAQEAPTSVAPRFGEFGVDLAGRDLSVKPGDDFYQFANGRWLASNTIPADRTRWTSFDVLAIEAESQVQAIVDSLPAGAVAGTAAQKVRDYYRSYLDTDAIERAGLEPIKPILDTFARAQTHADIAAIFGRVDLASRSPINMGIATDEKNPDRYIVNLVQGGLGLPEREYYLKEDAQFAGIRAQYLAHIGRMLSLAGQADAEARAKSIVDLETEIARLHWPVAKRRDRDLTYNLRTPADLKELAPDFPWDAMLTAADLSDRREFVVTELDAVVGIAQLFARIPVSVWRSYLTYHALNLRSDVLPKAFDDESFSFYGQVLSGQPQQRERWKRAVSAVNGALGEAVGQLYVERHFPVESKAKAAALVENLRRAFRDRISNVPWMTAETKQVALEKLAAFRPKIGYPDKWRDYSAFDVRPGDAFGNRQRYSVFAFERLRRRLDQPTDRDEWLMTPQTVNAYYESTFNEIVFPAAILQPPFFDPYADDAVNYGGIGAVIGHEMGHGFDDQGSKSDAKGILRTWWRPEDEAAFRKLVDGLAQQYDSYEALPGLHVNGRLTLGENVGDLGGLTVAYAAYRLSLNGREAPVLGGLTGDQRFFLSYAQIWRSLSREARTRNLVMTDPHSPPIFRVNGAVRNFDPWYSAFNVEPGDSLYLAPAERIRIW